jgi:hypothetical protein
LYPVPAAIHGVGTKVADQCIVLRPTLEGVPAIISDEKIGRRRADEAGDITIGSAIRPSCVSKAC